MILDYISKIGPKSMHYWTIYTKDTPIGDDFLYFVFLNFWQGTLNA